MKVRDGLRVGLALGGGAARGLAHIGVLKVIQEQQIPIDYVAGVSVGSIIGAALAAGLTPEQMTERAQRVGWKDLGRWSFNVRGFNRNDRMAQWLYSLLGVSRFEELRMPLRIVATDLHSGEPVVMEKGDLITAIRASCAIPGLYVPVQMGGALLADGYLTCNLPVEQVRGMGADVILASAIGLENSAGVKLNNIYKILMRSFSIMSAAVQKSHYPNADVIFEPDVETYSWSDMESAPQLVRAGERAARAKMDAVRQALAPQLVDHVK